jgi:hypothetical protein
MQLRHKLKNFTIALLLALSVGGLAAPALASASSFTKDACSGVAQIGGATCGSSSNTGIDNIITWVVNILSVIVGVAAVIMIIIGGFKYVTSGGEASDTAEAKNTIIYALVGIVIVVLAQVLVHFVLNKSSTAVKSAGTVISAPLFDKQ